MITVVRGDSELLLVVDDLRFSESSHECYNFKNVSPSHQECQDVEVNVLIVRRKVELIRIITIFEMAIFLNFVQSFPSIGFPRSIVISDAFFFLFRRLPRLMRRTKLSLATYQQSLG